MGHGEVPQGNDDVLLGGLEVPLWDNALRPVGISLEQLAEVFLRHGQQIDLVGCFHFHDDGSRDAHNGKDACVWPSRRVLSCWLAGIPLTLAGLAKGFDDRPRGEETLEPAEEEAHACRRYHGWS